MINGLRFFSAKPNTGSLTAAGRPPTRWSKAWSTPVRLLKRPWTREQSTVAD